MGNGSPTRSILEHKESVAALKASASEAALAVMRSHRQRSRVEILNTLTETSQERSSRLSSGRRGPLSVGCSAAMFASMARVQFISY
jgi:hypothetical protein